MTPDLSVLIPARNEEWLNRTVADVLAHSTADTEIIVVLDGAWPNAPLEQHPRVQVVYVPQSIGQRAATNLAARISTAKYICKLDAHCSVADGWDVVLLESAKTLGRDVMQIPAQHNLHVFDRVCQSCGNREYQGPTTTPCNCGATNWRKEVVWNAIRRRTESWRFDADLKFGYFGEYSHRPEAQGDIVDVMSCLGACWFVDREWYWQLGGLDENHGSWGQMGTELACMAWLSGGRMVVNRRTWFSHMFRTQGADFSFPYELKGSDVARAREYSQQKWRSGAWEHQVRPLRWLVDKFWPVPGWTDEQRDGVHVIAADGVRMAGAVGAWDGARGPTDRRTVRSYGRLAGVVYYSDCLPDSAILDASRATIERSGLPITAVTLKPIHWPRAHKIIYEAERGYLTMFSQILYALEACQTELVFFCEHDVLYHPSHFDFRPDDLSKVYYNQHVYKVDSVSGRALHYRCSQTSGLCGSRELLITHYRQRVALVTERGYSRAMGFEPGTHRRPERVDDLSSDTWMAEFPNIDIRHGVNLTPSRWKREQFRNQKYTDGWTEAESVPGWGQTFGRMTELLREIREPVAAVA